ncbi:3-phosphoserine/phosphohydroxythreonine transaminase [Desertivirga xinjiangensis]|uniref:3-phosphoserine/phosphohydroxythreonine transaminase n=1 Tax=Desertivirga xinjiangensis TaxID=539206 RepID=UPI00210D46C8|nr:3-phosphoserine/phosphohydroxythreonine transaminase [Pedobacter xinjiangensis]
MRLHNFAAGSAILPGEVFTESAQAVQNFNDMGLSILEISHRSPKFEKVIHEAESLLRELLSVPQGYSILFMGGGASLQFTLIPLSLLPIGGAAAFGESGIWAKKAIEQALHYGHVDVVATGKDTKFTAVPTDHAVPANASYLHITTNNIIFVAHNLKFFLITNVPIVADMSSDILSYEIDVAKYGLIYAGAQKNIRPAGVTVVIVKDDLLGKTNRVIPAMLDYKEHIKAGSLYNTPPVFDIYVLMLTLAWLQKLGGVKEVEKLNKKKAEILYEQIDSNPLFYGPVSPESRSEMNVVFRMNDESLEPAFLSFAKERGIIGINGHRSVGGFQASIYNAMPIESVAVLTQAMKDFTDEIG